MTERHDDRLVPLDALRGYQIADGDEDPRGWRIVTGDGRRIGKVHELLVSPALHKVRYLDCELDAAALGLGDERRHVLLPVEAVGLDPDDRQVIAGRITAEDVLALEPFSGLTLGPRVHEGLRRVFRDPDPEPPPPRPAPPEAGAEEPRLVEREIRVRRRE